MLFQSERPQLPGVTAPFPDWSGWSHCFVHHTSFKSTRDSGDAKKPQNSQSLHRKKKRSVKSPYVCLWQSVFLKGNFKTIFENDRLPLCLQLCYLRVFVRFWPQHNNKNFYCTPTIAYLLLSILYSYRPPAQRSGFKWKWKVQYERLGFLWRSCCVLLLSCSFHAICSAWALVSAFLQTCISLPVKWCAV